MACTRGSVVFVDVSVGISDQLGFIFGEVYTLYKAAFSLPFPNCFSFIDLP